MTEEQQKEQFSKAYVRAVAAAARVNIYEPVVDDDSVDIGFAIRSVISRPQPPRLEAQLKCTALADSDGQNFRFELLRPAFLKTPKRQSVVGRICNPSSCQRTDCKSVLLTEQSGVPLEMRDAVKLKNYIDLRGDHYVPRVLIVVVVPTVLKDWLIQNHESLALRHCGYWLSLREFPETTNTAKVTLAIPRAQMFTVEALRNLLGVGGTI